MRDEVSAALAALLTAKGVQGATITTSPVGDQGRKSSGDSAITSTRLTGGCRRFSCLRLQRGLDGADRGGRESSSGRESGWVGSLDKLGDAVRAATAGSRFHRYEDDDAVCGDSRRLRAARILVSVSASITSEGGQYKVAGLHLKGDIFMTGGAVRGAGAELHPGDVANLDEWKQIQDMVTAPVPDAWVSWTRGSSPCRCWTAHAHTVDYSADCRAGGGVSHGQADAGEPERPRRRLR